jgi:hypothetical protein
MRESAGADCGQSLLKKSWARIEILGPFCLPLKPQKTLKPLRVIKAVSYKKSNRYYFCCCLQNRGDCKKRNWTSVDRGKMDAINVRREFEFCKKTSQSLST